MLEQFGGGQWWFATWTLVATAERAMGAQDDVAKDEAQYERAQEIIAKELDVR